MSARLYRLAVLAAALMASTVLVASEEILYWMVDDSSTVSWWNGEGEKVSGSVSEFFDSSGAPEGSTPAARIRVTGGDIPDGADVFLDLYIPGYGVDVGGGEYGVEFSQVGSYWGAGVPTGNQSPSGNYAAGTPEYNFIVELGNIDSSDNWTTVAQSAAASYTSLGAFIHETFDLNPGQFAVWTPDTFDTPVPEPSSGLLILIGGGLLLLRRRRAGVT